MQDPVANTQQVQAKAMLASSQILRFLGSISALLACYSTHLSLCPRHEPLSQRASVVGVFFDAHHSTQNDLRYAKRTANKDTRVGEGKVKANEEAGFISLIFELIL